MCVKPTGCVVIVGNVSVSNVELPLGRMILFEKKVIGSSGATKEEVNHVINLVQSNKLKPILCNEFPLSTKGVNEAHSLLKKKGVMGRVILRCSL